MSGMGRAVLQFRSLVSSLIAAVVTLALLGALLAGVAGGSGAGNVITTPDTAGDVGSHASLVLDGSGNPVVSYYDSTNGDLKVLHCGDPNCSTGNVITSPDTAGNVGSYTSLALDSSGNPVVAYYDATTNGDLKVLHCGDPNCSTGNVITSNPSPEAPGLAVGAFTSLALDSSGNPVVSYWDETHFGLTVLHCGDPNCSSGNVIAGLLNGKTVSGVSSLALDSSGNPVVSYFNNGDLRVLHCGDPNCSAGNVITSPDPVGVVGSDSSLLLDASGNPVVSYRDGTNGDLKVLHCGDPNCSAGNVITSPDTAGNVGFDTSLALDGSGNPVVSYRDAVGLDGHLKLLHCGDPNCSAGNVITSPDPVANGVGLSTSLALDGSGNPVVSYYDGAAHGKREIQSHGNLDLKVLHCGDPNCTPPPVVWGDADCDTTVGTRDSQAILRNVLEQNALSQTQPCPLIGTLVTVDGNDRIWGDGDCDGTVGTRDSQAILRKVLEQNALSQTQPCPLIGDLVQVHVGPGGKG